MTERVDPTDPEYEAERGRVPLWLDADVVRQLATTCICGQPDASGRHERFCRHVQWRADAALHKAGLKRQVRLPEVRESLLRDVRTLTQVPANPEGEVAFGDAVEEVHHLLDPSHGQEPGDLLLREVEVAAAHQLWRALDRARWPIEALERQRDPEWHEVTRRAVDLLAKAR